jgi:hypothetical protein
MTYISLDISYYFAAGFGAAGATGAAAAGAAVAPTPTFSAFSAPCPWNVLVSANSPSLWPTMFSVTKTGTNFLPLCTAMVKPTISGKIVERLDQVFTTCLLFEAFVIFVIKCESQKGPFFNDLANFISSLYRYAE